MLYRIIAVSPVASKFNDTIEQYRGREQRSLRDFKREWLSIALRLFRDTIPFLFFYSNMWIRAKHSKWLTIHPIELGNKGGGVDRGCRGKTDGDLVPPSSCNQMELLSFLINLSSLIKGMLFSPHDASILVAAKGCALCNNYALYVNFTSISPLGSCAATIKDDGFETRPRVMAIIKQSGIWRKARNISRCFSPRDWSWKKELFRENVRSIYMCNDFYSASTRDAM